MKFLVRRNVAVRVRSLPARGVWVEISKIIVVSFGTPSHSPHGECGLKFYVLYDLLNLLESLPARGVWVEI